MKFLSKLSLAALIPFVCEAKPEHRMKNVEIIEKFLPRLAAIESSGNPDAIGDNGKSLGLYQIRKEAWRDATDWARLYAPDWLTLCSFNGIGKDYKKDCMNPETARVVATMYLLYLAKRMEYDDFNVNMKSLYMAYNCGYERAKNFQFDMTHSAISDKRRAIFLRAVTIIDAQLTTLPHRK